MSEIDKALANSPTYMRLAAEAMQEDNVKDLAGALKPAVDALRDVSAKLTALTIAQRDSAAEIKDGMLQAVKDNGRVLSELLATIAALRREEKAEKPLDAAPLIAALESGMANMGKVVTAALERNAADMAKVVSSLEDAVMADVQLVTTQGGRPTGARKVKRKL